MNDELMINRIHTHTYSGKRSQRKKRNNAFHRLFACLSSIQEVKEGNSRIQLMIMLAVTSSGFAVCTEYSLSTRDINYIISKQNTNKFATTVLY